MVINRKYEWKPEDDRAEEGKWGRNLGSFTQSGFRQILDTSSRAASRNARRVAAKIPGLDIAQELVATKADVEYLIEILIKHLSRPVKYVEQHLWLISVGLKEVEVDSVLENVQ